MMDQRDETVADQAVALPPSPPRAIIVVLNTLIALLLRSPLHGVLSKSCILLSFKGITSGRVYTFPVGYYEYHGDSLFLIPLHRWWKNLRGVPVTIWLKGRKYSAVATALPGDESTRNQLQRLVGASANFIRMYNISRDADGQPDPGRVRQVAEALPLIQIRLSPPK